MSRRDPWVVDIEKRVARSRRPRPPRPTPGVYFIRGAGLVKIGCTGSSPHSGIEKRVRTISAISPVPVELYRFIPTRIQGFRLEGLLHERFASERSHSEWFNDRILDEIDGLSDAEVIDLAEGRRRQSDVKKCNSSQPDHPQTPVNKGC